MELREFDGRDSEINTDDESLPPSPVFDMFYEAGGCKAIQDMINFDASEFNTIWGTTEPFISESYNLGPGRKGNFGGKDL